MADSQEFTCHRCGICAPAYDGDDGYFYCSRCGCQAEDIVDTGLAQEALVDPDGPGGMYLLSHRRRRPASSAIKAEPLSQSQFVNSLKALDDDFVSRVKEEEGGPAGDGVGPTGPSDFGSGSGSISYDDYYSEIRMKYVMGVQIMIELQCNSLVEKFRVSPIICGFAGTIWLRFVAMTGVLDDDWADKVIQDSESQIQGEPDEFKEPHAKYRAEPHNLYGQRNVTIWYRSLSKTIPLSHSLAISLLVCHLAREAVLPTDIIQWSLEGKLPYFAAFVEIEKQTGPSSSACPLSSSQMFRPHESVPLQKLESQAASIARMIGLELPPVNFHGIASRYLTQLSLPLGQILPSVCLIYEWSLPPELWLSANELRLPTRVYVMSMVIVAIRIQYNIHGFGFWETSLSKSDESSSADIQEEPTSNLDMRDDAHWEVPSRGFENLSTDSSEHSSDEKPELGAGEFLRNLEARYNELEEAYDYSKDLTTYLQYCKDVIFAGLQPSFEDTEEQNIIEELWDFYQNYEGTNDSKPPDDQETKGNYHLNDSVSPSGGQTSTETGKDRAIRQLKANMEENRFCYIPPRVNVKRLDYLHYVRKKDEGAYTYAAHADYYIVLRSCARVAQVDIRVMHAGVLSFERRLGWLEKRIDHCLPLGLRKDSCDFCCEEIQKNSTE